MHIMRIIARLNVGGPAIHVNLLAAGLNNGSTTSTLVTGRIGEHEGDMSYLADELGVTPVYIDTLGRSIRLFDDVRTLLALIRLMRKEKPDVVHTHTAKAGFVGRLAAWLVGVPVIVHTFHGHVFKGYFGPLKTRVFILLERLAARFSDVVLTISSSLREDLIELKIAPPEKLKIVPLGLRLTELTELETQRGQFRREIGCSTDAPLIGIIGRLVPIKNHGLFLRAAQRVTVQCPDARFVIVGDGERRAALETQTADLALQETVIFAGWRKDMRTVYADLDGVVISSKNEGTPVSLIEAMAAGVPVVSTDVGGVADLLHHGQFGTLVPLDDVEALSEAIMASITQDVTSQIDAARAHVLQMYSAENLVNAMRTLYTHTLAVKRPQ